MKREYLLPAGALLLLGLAYGTTLRDIALICWNDDDYSHGLLLPFIGAYLIRERLKGRATTPSSASLFSTLLLVGGACIYSVAAVGESTFGKWLSFFPTTLGVIGLIFGTEMLKLTVAPILLLFMAKPLPDFFIPHLFNPLQTLAARMSAFVLDGSGVPVHRVGNVVEVPGINLLVEEACSGLRSVFALLTVALIVAILEPVGLLGFVFLVAASLGLAIVFNVFRVALTGVLAHFYDPSIASGFLHSFTGFVTFLLGLCLLFWLGRFVTPKRQKSPPAGESFSRPIARVSTLARGAALSIVLVGGMSTLPFLLSRSVAPAEVAALTTIPRAVAEWRGRDAGALDRRSLGVLKLDQSLRRVYRTPNGEEIFVYVGYWKEQTGDHQAAKHSPAICLPSNGWTTWGQQRFAIPIEEGSRSLTANQLIGQSKGERHLFAYWFFSGRNDYTAEWSAMGKIVAEKLLRGRSDGGIIEISTSLNPTADFDEELRRAEQRVTDFVRDFYPHLDYALGRAPLRAASR